MSERRVPRELPTFLRDLEDGVDTLSRQAAASGTDSSEFDYSINSADVNFSATTILTALNVSLFVSDGDVVETKFKLHIRNNNNALRMYQATILIDGVGVEQFNFMTEDGNRPTVHSDWRLDDALDEGDHTFDMQVAPIDAGTFTIVGIRQSILAVTVLSAGAA